MSESHVSCPQCGGAIAADAPRGLCPKCLLQQGVFTTEAGEHSSMRPAEPPSVEALTSAFPHLQILELIGRGGMGFVFKARQPKLDRFVALKILAEALARQPSFAERFTREGRALARLNHPNIVTVHDFGQAGAFFYLLMEYVDGVNLRQAMRTHQISPAEALAIVPKICEALQYAHGEGILHRDIKPDNILLDPKGRVKIADFGIAKLLDDTAPHTSLTASGSTLGTVHYMAPEQIERPNEVDHRADIYSLGVVFYEMLTGELPIGRFPPPSEKSAVDPRLDKVVFKTLAKEPARRQQTATELGTEVETIAATPSPDERSRPGEWQVRCATCGNAKPLRAFAAFRVGAASIGKRTLLWCGHCHRMRRGIIERAGEPLPGARIPPSRIGVAKAAVFACVFLALMLLVRKAWRDPRPAYEPSVQPALTSNSLLVRESFPSNSLFLPAIDAPLINAPRSIRLFQISGTAQRITALSRTEFNSDEAVRAVISYSHGPWAPSEATASTFTVERDGTNRSFTATFIWNLPESFATSFDVRAEVQRASLALLNRPLPLQDQGVLDLFSIANNQGQVVSGGLEYIRRPLGKDAQKTMVTLEGIHASWNSDEIRATFNATPPAGYGFEAITAINSKVRRAVTTWNPLDDRVQVAWKGRFEASREICDQLNQLGSVPVHINSGTALFNYTNITGRPYNLMIKETNVLSGAVHLAPIHASE